MKNGIIFLLLILIASTVYGCGYEDTITQDSTSTSEEKKLSQNIQREIVDLSGNVVKVPSADRLNRVVIVSPPISSIQYSVLKDTSKIIAVHPLTFKNANSDIIKKSFENLDDVNSSFMKGFNIDTEAILNLNPDIIFYYGQQQKKGLESLKIPMVDFMKLNDRNPITITTEWEKLMRDIFDVKEGKTIKEEWDRVTEELIIPLKELDEDRLKGLMIFSNTSNKIMVSGNNTYGDYWLEMSGLTNVADDVNGEKEVGMEQIYEWNPDIIYVFMGEQALNYQKGIKGQDWSRVKAIKTNRIYDVPKGIFSWGAPNSDSPLMIKWMTIKNYPSRFKEDELNNTIKRYYENHYNMTLTDEMLSTLLKPNKERE
ncbi:ABC transporter substrate-binding protein [Wukongibacter sp. M2B1]|uniref:ABC transporter substrate-binding protein n=1 Tax=Wukongibacter sp. M2B1 TaxID=3088895 RepID=UPI003D7A9AF3